MLVNADLFADAGIELPLEGWTYAEFAEAAQKLTSGEGQDKVYGMYWNLNGGSFAYSTGFIGATLGRYKVYTDDTCTATNFDNEVRKQGIQLILDSYEQGWAPTYEEEVADDLSFATMFLEGKSAMSMGINNLRIINDLENYPHDFETAIVPAPVPDESYLEDWWNYSDRPGAGDLICINAKSEYVEDAVDFVIWYIKGGMAPLAKGGRIPLWKGFDANSIVEVLCEQEGVFNPESVKAYMSVDGTSAYEQLKTSVDSKIDDISKEEMEAILYGQKTVDQACADMKTRADELLANELQK